MKVLVLYFTRTGHTLEAATATARGIEAAGAQADLVAVGDFDPAKIANYDAVIVGSPCWSGMFGSGIAKPIAQALHKLSSQALSGKRCGGIAVNAAAGAQTTVKSIGEILRQKGCTDYRPGPIAAAGAPMSLWKGPAVKPADEESFKNFGSEFVK